MPLLQPCSPASLVTRTLLSVLGSRSSDFTYVDFCAGAGGPTPYIETEFNARLATPRQPYQTSLATRANSHGEVDESDATKTVDFVLTDIAPHIPAWTLAANKSSMLHFIPKPIDASDAPDDMLDSLTLQQRTMSRRIFRLFSLAFHHFPDPLAKSILANTLKTSSGFAILELQARNLPSLIMMALMGPLLLLITPFYFWRDPVHLIFTYLIPIIPFVVVFDGFISSVRTRTGEEIKAMIDSLEAGASRDWEIRWGSEWHTWAIGEMTWVIGMKNAVRDGGKPLDHSI